METELTFQIKEVYQTERSRLLAFIKSKVPSIEDAEDLLQDVFYSTLQSVSITQPIENIAGWLYKSAKNKIVDWYRKKKLPTVSIHRDEESVSISLEDVLSEFRSNPEHEFYRNILIDEITESIEELPESQKLVFIWNAIEGLTFKEISEMTGESIKTLLSRKHYAVRFLRNRLKEINDIIKQIR